MDFRKWLAKEKETNHGIPKMDYLGGGMIMTYYRGYPGNIAIIDEEGNTRWYWKDSLGVRLATLTPRNTILVLLAPATEGKAYEETIPKKFNDDVRKYYLRTGKIGFLGGTEIAEIDLTGKVLWRLNTEKKGLIIHHALAINKDSHIIAISRDFKLHKINVRGKVIDTLWGDAIVEIDSTGKVLKKWSPWSNWDISNDKKIKDLYMDRFHFNSFAEKGHGEYLLSTPIENQIWKVNINNGKLVWRFGKNGDFKIDKTALFYFQHDIQIDSQGHLTLFDNGDNPDDQTPNELRVSRTRSFSLDESSMTSKSIVDAPLPSPYYSSRMGGCVTLPNGNILQTSSKTVNCFNTEGTDYEGNFFNREINIPKGIIQPLWVGIQIPKDAVEGLYVGNITLSADGVASTTVPIRIYVINDTAKDKGIYSPWKQTRLHWLNSTLAQEHTIIPPYIPVRVSEKALSILGRDIVLGEHGLPKQIRSYFSETMTNIESRSSNMLSQPFDFEVIETKKGTLKFEATPLVFTRKEEGLVVWESKLKNPRLTISIKGSLEFDGFVGYQLEMTAKEEIDIADSRLVIRMVSDSAEYILGLGYKGGKCPEIVDWKWDVKRKNQDGVWLGNVNKGLKIEFKDEHYKRPLNTNFYLKKPLILPTSWGNNNKGGITVTRKRTETILKAYSGRRSLKKGESLRYDFTMLVTPFHTLQTDTHWENRYFHAYKPVDSIIESGANVVNIHHANTINPYINYPFIAHRQMKAYIDEAHEKGLKVKIYNTIREVSNKMYELHPLMSLNNEVFSKGSGGGAPWLQEHLNGNYIAAWYVPHLKDAAIINSGMNRWHNYYVEGMNWLVKNVGIDGVYLDDVAFDRVTMKRIKRVLIQDEHPGLIDLHSANQYNKRDGFNNSAYLYMEHFPYINRLWFGEYFDYEKASPEFFLTEVSGIPFGLMGEMLQNGGNQWRGMLYGMTNRMPWQKMSPDAIWKQWDDFGMQGSEMIGYWVKANPIKTNNKNILATVYKRDKKVLVALASWAEGEAHCKLLVDWKALGLRAENVVINIPYIREFQEQDTIKVNDEINIPTHQGLLIEIRESN
ncbi:hypothetical protein ElyMa_002322900 [Elysia marginata]|uniref:Glycoside hydrolase 123-like N-terminal domain-containing protein n=1 Tax=Elysia marginata TaxID=1093978 RepID=A0AAV4G695_9GAST|nr:hypothetical protein ElyMa_002322900 [Elysia marginata]